MTAPADWRLPLRQPIAQCLILSACLHLAAIVILQPAPGAGTPRTLVISARLEPPAKAPQAPAPAPGIEPPTAAAPAPPIVEPPPVQPAPTEPAPLPAPPSAPAPEAASAPPAAAPAGREGTGSVDDTPLPNLPIEVDTTWYLARQVDSPPAALDAIEPAYPPEARRRNLEGTLRLRLRIDDLGRVQAAEVVEANPPAVFDAAALAAFRAGRFRPAMRNGRPVRFEAYIRLDFKLED